MRTPPARTATTFVFAVCLLPAASAQAPLAPPVPEEIRALLKEVERAYKDPAEVDKDILDELRKQYRDPTPDRENKIFREIRRLYVTNPSLEEGILREMRRAYQQPTTEQEARFFEAVRRGGQFPPGAIPHDLLAERAAKAFGKLDRNADGVLGSDELPDVLRAQVQRWDRNRDGAVDSTEYLEYFQAGVKWAAEAVASGQLPLKLPKGAGPDPGSTSTGIPTISSRGIATPDVAKQVTLPDWFTQLDEDHDRQVGLYEWRKAGRPVREFLGMDRNNDGYLESRELLAYLAANPSEAATDRKGRKRGR